MFTNEFATMCLWTEWRKNNKLKFGDSELIKIIKSTFVVHSYYYSFILYFFFFFLLLKAIKDSCKKNIFTDMEFEKVVSDWLRYVNTRFQRLQK